MLAVGASLGETSREEEEEELCERLRGWYFGEASGEGPSRNASSSSSELLSPHRELEPAEAEPADDPPDDRDDDRCNLEDANVRDADGGSIERETLPSSSLDAAESTEAVLEPLCRGLLQ